jgi:hypothetical protein
MYLLNSLPSDNYSRLLGLGPKTSSVEYGNEPWDSIKYEGFVEQLRPCSMKLINLHIACTFIKELGYRRMQRTLKTCFLTVTASDANSTIPGPSSAHPRPVVPNLFLAMPHLSISKILMPPL